MAVKGAGGRSISMTFRQGPAQTGKVVTPPALGKRGVRNRDVQDPLAGTGHFVAPKPGGGPRGGAVVTTRN